MKRAFCVSLHEYFLPAQSLVCLFVSKFAVNM